MVWNSARSRPSAQCSRSWVHRSKPWVQSRFWVHWSKPWMHSSRPLVCPHPLHPTKKVMRGILNKTSPGQECIASYTLYTKHYYTFINEINYFVIYNFFILFSNNYNLTDIFPRVGFLN